MAGLKAARPSAGNHRSVWSDQAGSAKVEYALLMAVFAFPMLIGFRYALWILQDHYAMWTYLNGWPFP